MDEQANQYDNKLANQKDDKNVEEKNNAENRITDNIYDNEDLNNDPMKKSKQNNININTQKDKGNGKDNMEGEQNVNGGDNNENIQDDQLSRNDFSYMINKCNMYMEKINDISKFLDKIQDRIRNMDENNINDNNINDNNMDENNINDNNINDNNIDDNNINDNNINDNNINDNNINDNNINDNNINDNNINDDNMFDNNHINERAMNKEDSKLDDEEDAYKGQEKNKNGEMNNVLSMEEREMKKNITNRFDDVNKDESFNMEEKEKKNILNDNKDEVLKTNFDNKEEENLNNVDCDNVKEEDYDNTNDIIKDGYNKVHSNIKIFENKIDDNNNIIEEEEEEEDYIININEMKDKEKNNFMEHINNNDEYEDIYEKINNETEILSSQLCEELKMILEPTIRNKYEGDYKSGKKLNIKKLVNYFASDFRNNKIWKRKTKLDKRDYNIIIAIDNTKSMKINNIQKTTLNTIFLVAKAFEKLNVGKISICSFGENEKINSNNIVCSMTNNLNKQDFLKILNHFQFNYDTETSFDNAMLNALKICNYIFKNTYNHKNNIINHLMLIISDGRFNKNSVKSEILKCIQNNFIPILMIIDTPASNNNNKKTQSIFDLKQTFYKNNKLQIVPYLHDFPFPYFVVVDDLNNIPSLTCDIIRQWFEILNNK
ncbi:hypothetical protein PFBG_05388 [Plasmodium falciparum 7G8]|nr:hypothetical protein PFBG_05388 [Plasmodium falciparum 7G8]